MEFPKTLTEFQAAYPDEEACTKALRKMRWPEGFVCPRCQHTESSFLHTRNLEQCGGCRYQCSVTAGTIFHGTRTPSCAKTRPTRNANDSGRVEAGMVVAFGLPGVRTGVRCGQ